MTSDGPADAELTLSQEMEKFMTDVNALDTAEDTSIHHDDQSASATSPAGCGIPSELKSAVGKAELSVAADLATTYACKAGIKGYDDVFTELSQSMDDEQAKLSIEIKGERGNKKRIKVLSVRGGKHYGAENALKNTISMQTDSRFASLAVTDLMASENISELLQVKPTDSISGSGGEANHGELINQSQAEVANDTVSGDMGTPHATVIDSQTLQNTSSSSMPVPEPTERNTDMDMGVTSGGGGTELHAFPKVNVSPPSRIVTSVKQGLEFQKDALQFLMTDDECNSEPEEVLNTLHTALLDDSVSTCYSGIESVHTATNCNAFALSDVSGNRMIDVPLLHMIEWDSENQKEFLLVASKHPCCCIYGDVCDFFRDEIKQSIIPQLKDLDAKSFIHIASWLFFFCIALTNYKKFGFGDDV